jgi:nucleoside-diphosphate-sugar epimerase
MRVFLAGASGVIGRRLVPQLVAAGHTVVGMTRRPERAEELRAAGAEPAVCDVFDAEALRRTVVASQPEVVVHELTDLPANLDPRRAKEAYARNDRIRREGTSNLVAAAVAGGARRMVAQSIAFVYRPEGDAIKTEDAPMWDDAPEPFTDSIAAVRQLEDMVTGADGIEGLVLRYGFFYGPGTGYASDGSMAAMVRKRRFPVLGKGAGVFSYIHIDDAAAATVAAVERGAPGIYNVVDDDPAAVRDWLPAYAEAVDAKPPRRMPAWVGRLVAGKFTAAMATDLRGASNEKAKRELDWQPRHSSWRQGFREALG